MTAIIDTLYSTWNQVCFALSNIRILDIIDILAIAFIIYKLICFARDTRAGQLVKGIVILFVMYLIAKWFSLPILRWLLGLVVNSSFVVLVVLFHPEIRHMLERVGSSKITSVFDNEESSKASCIETVCKAAGLMQDSKTGALIVFERNMLLGEIVNSGTVIDAAPSVSLITNMFFPNSPLHDGAVIVRGDRVYAAGCILPLSQNKDISNSLGTRHRAAIGMSEESDAVILVVSEETGNISIVCNGKITRNYSSASATLELKKLLLNPEADKKDGSLFTKIKKISPFKKDKKSAGDEVKSDE